MKHSDNELVERLKNGDIRLLENIYLEYKPAFTEWVKQKYGLHIEDIEDIWQEVVIIFFENVKKNKLEVLKVKLITYLYAIGKHLIYKLLDKRNRNLENHKINKEEDDTFQYFGEDELKQETNILASRTFSKLGKSCQELLIARYYYGKSVEEICMDSGLSSKNTVSASISRCIKQLKELIFKNGVQ
ncbi:MAG: sigma-70 family RNA polymerase sigma factor [Saprospiraceae bacterium]|nr:sigma-70 family RNA polymerase sigma factor [Saprospiraceae bacterium]